MDPGRRGRCPTSPMTHDDLSALLPLEALHCYGNDQIVVAGTVEEPEGVGYEGPRVQAGVARPPAPVPFLATASGHVIGSTPTRTPTSSHRRTATSCRDRPLQDPAATSCR